MEALAVSTKTAAAMIGLSVNTVKTYTRTGRIRTVRAGRRTIIPIRALEEFLQIESHPGPAALSQRKSEKEN